MLAARSSELAHQPETGVRLSEVIASLSYALDITEGQPEGHASRTCLIGMRVAEAIDLPAQARSDLFYGLLLKDLGCSSNAAKMCYLFGADDRRIKRDLKTVDWPRISASMKFVREHVAPNGSTLEKLLAIASLALQGPSGPKKLVQTRCERGSDIAKQLGFSDATAAAILQLDEHWNGQGHPCGLKGEDISILARIMGLSQTVEVFMHESGVQSAVDIAQERRGRWFDPELVDAFVKLALDDTFETAMRTPNPGSLVPEWEPKENVLTMGEAELDTISLAFASVVDAKSPWTYKHSNGVSDIAVGISKVMGHSEQETRLVRRMGLLHDIGKLGVSNAVLDKPGKLTDDEFTLLKDHTFHTREILGRVSCFADSAELAASHHEKLDGRGYHRGINSGELPVAGRLLAIADIFEALTAARPYREGLPVEKALSIIEEDAGKKVCAESFDALKEWLSYRDYTSRIDTQLDAINRLVDDL